eukprot:CAMPEP_0197628082 /NCGR_PEP_ID=MMETSP1338-20131121/6503_1 /TAXON_ID=43686 ORGANISM="Pelagodinium beii, Strain RCC1491" /NCGR_SAMPLE_ID=MMETSP1338 /ASSEMBLY_ACC=CAM_ASM_000754 /LENGTH=589 /DNA_ID=CAMNT_0043198983 /DNA_START=90 /DNA_END=1859 /DNA_ORIENTATION=+
MGSAASIDNEESIFPSVQEVNEAHFRDDFMKRTKQYQELLEREQARCQVVGYEAAAFFTQPLMQAKLDQSLDCIETVTEAYSNDQKRVLGYTEVGVSELAMGGPISTMCVLADKATLACASDEGPIWIYNWREGRVVSKFRDQNPNGPSWGGGKREACKVRRLCPVSQDHRLLGSGDEHGYVNIWDLNGPDVAIEARLHEKAVAGLVADYLRNGIVTAGEDCYICLYDLEREQVRCREVPAPLSDGSGIPNTCLSLGGERFPNLVLVGGADGKLRLWDQATSSMKRRHTISMGGVTPTQCLLAPNGWQLLVTCSLGETAFSGIRPERGGLYVYDIRKLSDGASSSEALLTQYKSGAQASVGSAGQLSRVSSLRSEATTGRKGSLMSSTSRMMQGLGIGALDVVLVEEEKKMMALTLMDNVIRAFDLGTGEEKPVTAGGAATRGTAAWEFDVTEQWEPEYVNACALTSVDRYVMVATTGPSMGVWRRPLASQRYGHDSFKPAPPPPLELRSRCSALSTASDGFPEEVLLADPLLRPGEVLTSIESALQADEHRHQHKSGLASRPAEPTPCHALSFGRTMPAAIMEEAITA